MKVKDRFSKLFSAYHKKYPSVEFITNSLDGIYIMKYGEKNITTYASTEEITNIIDNIYNFYNKKWTWINNYYETILENIAYGGDSIKKEDIGLEKHTTITKLASYDIGMLEDSDSNEYEKQPYTKTTTTTESAITGYKSKFEYLQNTNFYDIIFIDVNKLLTLDIYKED